MTVPADIYEEDVDFTALALRYPDFAKRLKSNGQLDFSDPESVRQLTKALLHRDFDLAIDLPGNRLCPPVPNRFNYVNFVQNLVDTTRFDYGNGNDTTSKVLVLDIGTGASAIYPLLICRQRSNWYCLATEIDTHSRQHASNNIKSNRLESKIRLVDTDQSGRTILPSSAIQQFDDFSIKVMLTNPPFYSSEAELLASAKQKSRPPNSACTGAPVEMITPGGEVQFISRIIHESTSPMNRHKIQWFSSMLGKYSSISPIVTLLKQLDCSNYATTEFVQGQKTRRWCIAWSWITLRPPPSIARGIPSLEKKLLPFPSEYTFEPSSTDPSLLIQKLHTELSKLDLTWQPHHPSSTPSNTNLVIGIGISPDGDVWSRRARRNPKPPPQQPHSQSPDEEMEDADSSPSPDFREPALAFKISLSITSSSQTLASISTSTSTSTSDNNSDSNGPTKLTVTLHYLQGQNQILFESLCGWMKRRFT